MSQTGANAEDSIFQGISAADISEQAAIIALEQSAAIEIEKMGGFSEVEQAEFCRVISEQFKALKQAGILYQDHAALYEAIGEYHFFAKELAETFIAFIGAGIHYQKNSDIYKYVIHSPYLAPNFPKVLGALKESVFTFQDDPEIYRAVLMNPMLADRLISRFSDLKQAGILYQDHALLYKAIVEKFKYGPELIAAFVKLYVAGILKQGQSISLCCQTIIENPDSANDLATTFVSLKNAGLLYQDYPELFQVIIQGIIKKRVCVLADAVEASIVLVKAGFSYQNHTKLFEWLVINKYSCKRVALAFISLIEANISFSDNIDIYNKVAHVIFEGNLELLDALCILSKHLKFPECFTTKTLVEYPELMAKIISTLIAAKFCPTLHQKVFRTLISKLNHEKVEPISILDLIDKLCRFAEVNELDDLAALENIIETYTSINETLSFGPLNKNESTRKIEQLLEKLSDKNIFDKAMWEYKNESYFVTLDDGASYNLSLLIKNANLCHLTLSDKLIRKLGIILKDIIKNEAWVETSEESVVKLLPPEQQAAITIYTSICHKKINLLFRGEKLEYAADDDDYIVTKKDDHLIPANFIVGCLLNDALNKLNGLVDNKRPQVRLFEAAARRSDSNPHEFVTKHLQRYLNKITEGKYKKELFNVISELTTLIFYDGILVRKESSRQKI